MKPLAMILTAFFTLSCLSGCFSMVTGIKSYKGSDGSEIQFVTGADFSISGNGIDTVENRRGIKR